MAKEGCDTKKFMEQVKDIVCKTIITAQPSLSHIYRICQPECLDNSMAFQILGFDIMIDHKFKPYLIEVNQSPSFATDSPLDYKIKKAVIFDAFKLLNFNYKRRKQQIKQKKERIEQRIRTGKTFKLTPAEREKLRGERLQERFKYEATQCNGYELIFPCGDKDKSR